MKLRFDSLAIGAISIAMLAASARADVSVMDNDKTLEVDCAKDPQINLIGNHIKLKAKGVCAKITISGNQATVAGSARTVLVMGNHNAVSLAAADDVSINGNDNTVSVAGAIKLKTPRVSNTGTGNTVAPTPPN